MFAASHLLATLFVAHARVMAAADKMQPFPDRRTQEQWRRAEEFARKGVEDLLRSFEHFNEALPVYGAPYIDGNGDIVIPRRPGMPSVGTPVPEPPPERT